MWMASLIFTSMACVRYGEREKEKESSFTVSEKCVKLKASVRLAGGLSAGFSEVLRSGLVLRMQKSMTVSRPEPGQNVTESIAQNDL